MEVKNVENKIKPFVCIASFKLTYVEKKHFPKIKSKNIKTAKDSRAKYIKTQSFVDHPITLERYSEGTAEAYRFPTKKTEKRVLQGVWAIIGKKNSFDSFAMYITDINVKSKSHVSYDFDYEKD
tara:strand:- start:571 stop:942 length:372 start_codon:yes stop_codon:yes gene_type:complete